MANRALPGPYNTYVPNAKSSGNLIVDYSRNINEFAALKYCQLVPTQNTLGIWYQMGLDQRARIIDSDLAKYAWADSADRPDPRDTAEWFSELEFRTKRYSFGARIGKMTSEQAVWDEIDRQNRSLAQQAMTARTVQIITALTTTGNWNSTHVADLAGAGISGVTGNWASSTAARLNIKRSLNYIKNLILLDTRAAVKSKDLLLIMSPDTAQNIAVSQEIVELVKQNPAGPSYLFNKGEFSKETFGLPSRLYDTEYVIEETVRVTTQRGLLTQTAAYVVPLGTIIVVHKPNSLEGVEGGRSFATASIFVYRNDDMKSEQNSDSWNRVDKTAITDNYVVGLTAPPTGFLLQNVC